MIYAVQQNAVDVHLNGGFTFDTEMKDTPLELKAAGYPDMILDTKGVESSYIKFNEKIKDNPNGNILCHYKRTILGVGDQYFDINIAYNASSSLIDGHQVFDYPLKKANEDAQKLLWTS